MDLKRHPSRGTAAVLGVALALGLVAFLAAPAGAEGAPSLQVTPSSALRNGQRVIVTATGLTDGQYNLYECIQYFETPLFCNTAVAQLPVVNGTASTTVSAVEEVSTPQGVTVGGGVHLGTMYDTCQALLSFCGLYVAPSNVQLDPQFGILRGWVAAASIRFIPAVQALRTSGIFDAPVTPIMVRPPVPVYGQMRVWECVNQSAGSACADVTVRPGFSRRARANAPALVLVSVKSSVNGLSCQFQGPFGPTCVLFAGTALGTTSGNVIGGLFIGTNFGGVVGSQR